MRNYSIDTVKCLAAFAVVMIHTQPFKLYEDLFLINRAICSFAVPFFFASSGYLLFNGMTRSNNKFKYLIRYLIKIMKILFVSILIYILYNIMKFLISDNPKLYIVQFINSIIELKNIYYGIDVGGMFHMWYLFSILYIVPIIYIFKNKINKLLIVSLIINLLGIVIQVINLNIYVRDALFYGLFYLTLGYWIAMNEEIVLNKICNINTKKLLKMLLIFNIIQIIEAFVFNRITYSFSTIIITFILFIICIRHKDILKDGLINNFGRFSLGVYIIHPMIIDIVYLLVNKFRLVNIEYNILWNLLITPFIFIISLYLYKWNINILNKYKNKKYLIKSKYNI